MHRRESQSLQNQQIERTLHQVRRFSHAASSSLYECSWKLFSSIIDRTLSPLLSIIKGKACWERTHLSRGSIAACRFRCYIPSVLQPQCDLRPSVYLGPVTSRRPSQTLPPLWAPVSQFITRGRFMQRAFLLVVLLSLAALPTFVPNGSSNPARRGHLVVGDDKVECPD